MLVAGEHTVRQTMIAVERRKLVLKRKAVNLGAGKKVPKGRRLDRHGIVYSMA
jgi:hypothetical protein